MKKLIFLTGCVALLSSVAIAQEAPSFEVLERKARTNGTITKKVALEDLESANSFDGKHFKIVKAKSGEAIRFDDMDKMLIKKAANVYHHLTKARNYWESRIDANNHMLDEKVVVRLEITNLFDELGHFANDNRIPQYNNALSIPAGETPEWVPAEKQDKWGSEIWFRPMKMINTKDLPNNLGANPVTAALQTVEQPFLNYTQNRFNMTLVEHFFYSNYAERTLLESFVRFAGTIALTKAVIEGSKLLDNLFVEKHYYLDTAMVPEIIYHEYAHLMLSDHLEMSHSTPVIEGMADYFAAALSQKKKVYAPVKGHSNAAPKKPRNKKTYTHWAESNAQANADFVLALLWDVRDVLGEDAADRVVYASRKHLDTESATINHHLLESLLVTCKEECDRPRADKFKLYEAFAERGL